MKKSMKKQNRGFTFIELVLSLTIFGVVGVMAIPQYVDAAQQALDDSLWEKSVAVKNAHDLAVSRTGLPSVSGLASILAKNTGTESTASADVRAVAGGVQVQVSGKPYVVPTYTNSLCTELTQNVNDTVGCIGAISS